MAAINKKKGATKKAATKKPLKVSGDPKPIETDCELISSWVENEGLFLQIYLDGKRYFANIQFDEDALEQLIESAGGALAAWQRHEEEENETDGDE